MRKYNTRMTPEGLDRVLKKKALDTYGDKVDALIGAGSTFEGSGVRYNLWVGFHGKAAQGFARAIAVHLTSDPKKSGEDHSVSGRLRDLEEALRAGLITQQEFERQRE